ncbi:MAG: ABC transporter ATP-binding protein [Spirochaetes bacterium]|nr:ABC transporter ATP-binding protein [Spirochaetota bacterium]
MVKKGSVPVLEVEKLTVSYETERGVYQAVRDISFSVKSHESFGLVGESGSGKSTVALAIVRYLASNGKVTGGNVRFHGTDVYSLPISKLRSFWGSKIGMVYQNPQAALNPTITIGKQLAEMGKTHLGMSDREARQKACEILEMVAMPDPESVIDRYPYQLSGGMLQRCVIAMALITKPELLIMDEPTTGLDVTTQAVILDLIADLQKKFDSAILYITHNLAVVANICDRIGVMYAGNLMEQGTTQQVVAGSKHPYTFKLLECVPRFEHGRKKQLLSVIPGSIPRLDEIPRGCVFAPRCILAERTCSIERPPLIEIGQNHYTSCRLWKRVHELKAVKPEAIADRALEDIPFLKVTGVKKYYPARVKGEGIFGKRKRKYIKSVDGVTLWVNKGRTLGIVGESGSGKTTLARVISGLAGATSGDIELDGEKLGKTIPERKQTQLRKIQMVFQNPETSLNPYHTIAETVGRPITLMGKSNKREIRDRVISLLNAVKLSSHYYSRLPGELSGGEKQRVAIARAFASVPGLIILDEPLSSLDVSVQGSLLNLLIELQLQSATSYIFISHDLAVVQHISDWVVVMYLGHIVEWGDAVKVLKPPFHPYTEALLSAIPVIDSKGVRTRIRLEGSVPSALDIPSGCRFNTRCPRKPGEICRVEEPPWQEGKDDHWIRCHIPMDKLDKLQQPAMDKT